MWTRRCWTFLCTSIQFMVFNYLIAVKFNDTFWKYLKLIRFFARLSLIKHVISYCAQTIPIINLPFSACKHSLDLYLNDYLFISTDWGLNWRNIHSINLKSQLITVPNSFWIILKNPHNSWWDIGIRHNVLTFIFIFELNLLEFHIIFSVIPL